MKNLLFLAVLCLLATTGWAQSGAGGNPFRLKFRLGRVVLMSGDTLDGPVALQFGPDLLFLAQPDGTIRTFAPVAVAACAVQQQMTTTANNAAAISDPNLVRLFRALPWHPDRNRNQPEYAFFEQLGGGPVLLLRRQRLAQRTVAYAPVPATVGAGMFGIPVGGNSRGLPPYTPPRYLSLAELHDDYYLARTDDDLVPLRAGLKDLLGAFPDLAPQLQTYAQAHHLTAGSARELAELVGYVNSLVVVAAP